MKKPNPPCWVWQGINRNGTRVNGYAFEPPVAFRQRLWRQHRIRIQQIRRRRQLPLSARQLQLWQHSFTQGWLTLLSSGISQLRCFEMLARQACHGQIHAIIERIIHALHEGHSLHHSLSQSGGEFSRQYCRLIEAGEYSGQLVPVLQRLSSQMQTRMNRQQMTRKALTYPTMVLFIACLVVALMLYLVVPQFAVLYQQMDAPLPASTTRLLTLADALLLPVNWLWTLTLLPLVWFLRRTRRWVEKYPAAARTAYALPLLGRLWHTLHLEQDMRVFSLAIDSHLPLTDACRLARQSSASASLQRIWHTLERHLNNGDSLTDTLKTYPLLESNDIQQIEVGEHSGQLGRQLHAVTARLEQVLNTSQQRILSAMEPALLLITGSVCGAILLALYTPLFQLGQLVG